VKWFLLREQLLVVWRYYRNVRFAFVDCLYGLVALFSNPYRACRKFLQKKGENDVYTYGETPLSTFHKLAKAAQLSSEDAYVELGSGRGKTCLWASLFFGCSVRGVEWVPSFVRLSRFCARIACASAQFELNSFFTADLRQATVVYFYGIHLDTTPLLKQFAQMPKGSRLITISEPIESDLFEVVKEEVVFFPWGKTEAYVQVRLV
jgi:hypothetical protein